MTDAIVQGVLLGGLYALFAAGLAIVFGVMKIVNLAHGDLIILSAYFTLVLADLTSWNPMLTVVLVAAIMGLLGYLLQTRLDPTLARIGSAPSPSWSPSGCRSSSRTSFSKCSLPTPRVSTQAQSN